MVTKKILGGNEYYSFSPVTLPNGAVINLLRVSLCPHGLEEAIEQAIFASKKEVEQLAAYRKKKEEEHKKKEEEKKEKTLTQKKEALKKIDALKEGEIYGQKGSEVIPFRPEEIGSRGDYILSVEKIDGKLMARCVISGDVFGSKQGYYSDELVPFLFLSRN